MIRFRFFIVIFVVLFSESTLSSNQENTSVGGGAYIGRMYDGNVIVEDLGLSIGVEDYVTTMGFSANIDQKLYKSFKASVSYAYSDRQYDTFSQYDLQTSLIGGSLSAKAIDSFKIGINFNRADAKLDGEDYLSYQGWSPSVGRFVNSKLYFISAYTVAEKEFNNRLNGDVSSLSWSADWYFFASGRARVLSFGYRFKQEDSGIDRFDYRSHAAKASFLQKTQWFSYEEKFIVGARYESRDYGSDTSGGRVERKDDRINYFARYGVAPTKSTYIQLEYQHLNYVSNIDVYRYSQDKVSFVLGLAI